MQFLQAITIMADKLHPLVYWAQSDSHITLKIELRNVKDPEIIFCEEELEFAAVGDGARGTNEYHFVLEFYLPIDHKESKYVVSERQIDFQIKKTTAEYWPRLTYEQKKPAWLKVDFEKWKPDDDDDEAEEENFNPDFLKQHADLFNTMKDDKFSVSPKMLKDAKNFYLFLYNFTQFLGFLYVFALMFINYADKGPDSMESTYENVGNPMKFLHLLMILEIIHPLTGYTKGSPLMVAAQVLGRMFIIFIMIDAEPRMQTKPIVFYLFFTYAFVEVIRYPYYMLRTYKINIQLLTWLRYTIWIPLYPFGFLCEGVVILRNIPYFEETHKFCVTLPNDYNFSFDLPTAMRLYLLCLCFPLLYCFMTHMYRQRVKQIGPKSAQTKTD